MNISVHRSVLRRLWLLAIALCFAAAFALMPRGGVLARPAVETADEAAERRVSESFQPVRIDAALRDQHRRIIAAVSALPPHPPRAETIVLAIGGSGFQAIFDREARRSASVLGTRFGAPAIVLSNTAAQAETGLLASPRTVAWTIAELGRRARPDDTLVVYLASHGGPEGLIAMDAPRLDFAPLTARRLAAELDRAGLKRRLVIVSACFGASWMPALASPTTIVVAAAAADRTSFGCDDSRELTVFGEALLGEVAHGGLPLSTAFDRAKRRITAAERAEQATPSRPEAAVGTAMTMLWQGVR